MNANLNQQLQNRGCIPGFFYWLISLPGRFFTWVANTALATLGITLGALALFTLCVGTACLLSSVWYFNRPNPTPTTAVQTPLVWTATPLPPTQTPVIWTVTPSPTAVIWTATPAPTDVPTQTPAPTYTPYPTYTPQVQMPTKTPFVFVDPGFPWWPPYWPTQPAPTAQPIWPTAQPPAAGPVAHLNCPDTETAKADLGLDVQRLDTEQCSWVWRGIPASTTVSCPMGYICTLHLASGEKKLFVGDGKQYTIFAGTFRWINGFSADDDVHQVPPCALLQKEQTFGSVENPTFGVTAGNFSCSGSPVVYAGGSNATTQACPATATEVASLVGGDAQNWTMLENGWKYGMKPAPAVKLTWPGYGKIDYPNGTLNSAGGVTASVATFWCLGQ